MVLGAGSVGKEGGETEESRGGVCSCGRPLLLSGPRGVGRPERAASLGLIELYVSPHPPELVVSLEECEQLVAELQGNVRQAVRLYHLVRAGHPSWGR